MHPVISLLEEYKLVTPEQVEASILDGWPIKQVEAFGERLYQSVRGIQDALNSSTDPGDPLAAFNFAASLSMSGEAACCEHGCRRIRAQLLARYAALYADLVVAPLPIVDPRHYHRSNNLANEDDFRSSLAGTVLCIQEMRPAIEAGLVAVVTPDIYLCPHCAPREIRNNRRIGKAARELANWNKSRFTVAYEGPLPIFHVKGPDEFLEHGEIWRLFKAFPHWFPQSYRHKSQVVLPRSMVDRSKIIDTQFEMLRGVVTLQEFFAFRYQAKALTTNPGELALLSKLNPANGIYSRATSSLSRISHVIPMMHDVPLATVIRVRREEGDAFVVYRKALTTMLREVVDSPGILTEKRASEIVSDVLEPEVARLRNLEHSLRTAAVKKACYRLAFAGAIVTMGLYRGLLPSEYAAIGSAAALGGLVDSLADMRTKSSALRNDNFYFLLRLAREGGSARQSRRA